MKRFVFCCLVVCGVLFSSNAQAVVVSNGYALSSLYGDGTFTSIPFAMGYDLWQKTPIRIYDDLTLDSTSVGHTYVATAENYPQFSQFVAKLTDKKDDSILCNGINGHYPGRPESQSFDINPRFCNITGVSMTVKEVTLQTHPRDAEHTNANTWTDGRFYATLQLEGSYKAPLPVAPFTSHLTNGGVKQANNLVLVTHGVNPSSDLSTFSWVDDMANDIRDNVSQSWEVMPYKWLSESTVGLMPEQATNNAVQLGKLEGNKLAAMHYDNIHLVAHSAGAVLIEAMAKQIALKSPDTKVQCTFLDPYTPLYGPQADGSFGKYADWSDQYYTSGELAINDYPRTGGTLQNAFNVNITPLNPSGVDAHSWPHLFYDQTVNGNEPAAAKGYGFPLSLEGGQFNAATHPKGTTILLGGPTPTPQPEPKVTWHSLPYINRVESTHSDTGTIELLSESSLKMTTGSPVWFNTLVDTVADDSLVQFNVEFTSDLGAKGMFGVYLDYELIGSLDESLTDPGKQTYIFPFEDAIPGQHVLSFRLDPYTDVHSSMLISDISFGTVQSTPEPSTLVLGALALLALAGYRLSSRKK